MSGELHSRMDDYLYAGLAFAVSATVVGACSTYEYFRCRQLLSENPEYRFRDLARRHRPAEYLTLLIGAPGMELARRRYHRRDR